MPELPEVETIAQRLRPELVGKSITSAELLWGRTLATPAPQQFQKQIIGQEIKAIDRRAKYLQVRLSDFHLFYHLRMSGDLMLRGKMEENETHDRLLLSLNDDKVLAFNDTRKFGRVWLVQNPDEVIGKLGPEPLDDDFTTEMLYDSLQSRHRQLKSLLLDQSFLAGMGNIYTDEALHTARLHPLTKSDSLNRKQVKALWEAIRNVLKEGIRRNGASIDWVYRGGEFQNYFRVYDQVGQPCPVCGTTIERLVVGQRGTHICPNCQKNRR